MKVFDAPPIGGVIVVDRSDFEPASTPEVPQERNCLVCYRPIAQARLKRYPAAVLCGRLACTAAHRTRKTNAAARRWRRKRLLLDPDWREEVNANARLAHARRKRARDTKQLEAARTRSAGLEREE